MAFSYTPKLDFPLKKYRVNGDRFLKDCSFDGVRWGLHLGEDVNVPAGTKVRSIGRGRVVHSSNHPGKKEKGKLQRNWGNIIIIAHKNPLTKKVFFSLYGHLQKRLKRKGERVELGEIIGTIAKSKTPENGMWDEAHSHFAIYIGPYPWKIPNGKPLKVLPGYYNPKNPRTLLRWWKNPTEFVKKYPKL